MKKKVRSQNFAKAKKLTEGRHTTMTLAPPFAPVAPPRPPRGAPPFHLVSIFILLALSRDAYLVHRDHHGHLDHQNRHGHHLCEKSVFKLIKSTTTMPRERNSYLVHRAHHHGHRRSRRDHHRNHHGRLHERRHGLHGHHLEE